MFEERKRSTTSNNATSTNLFRAGLDGKFGQDDNIRIFGDEEMNYEDIYERVANQIGVKICKQYIILFRLLSRKQGSYPMIAKYVRRETKPHVTTHEENSFKNFFNNYDVTPLLAKVARTLQRSPDVKDVIMFNERVVLTMSNDERHIPNKLFDLRKRNIVFVDSVWAIFVRNFFSKKQSHLNTQINQKNLRKYVETSPETIYRIFDVTFCFISSSIDTLQQYLDFFGKLKISFLGLAEDWISNVNEPKMSHAKRHLASDNCS